MGLAQSIGIHPLRGDGLNNSRIRTCCVRLPDASSCLRRISGPPNFFGSQDSSAAASDNVADVQSAAAKAISCVNIHECQVRNQEGKLPGRWRSAPQQKKEAYISNLKDTLRDISTLNRFERLLHLIHIAWEIRNYIEYEKAQAEDLRASSTYFLSPTIQLDKILELIGSPLREQSLPTTLTANIAIDVTVLVHNKFPFLTKALVLQEFAFISRYLTVRETPPKVKTPPTVRNSSIEENTKKVELIVEPPSFPVIPWGGSEDSNQTVSAVLSECAEQSESLSLAVSSGFHKRTLEVFFKQQVPYFLQEEYEATSEFHNRLQQLYMDRVLRPIDTVRRQVREAYLRLMSRRLDFEPAGKIALSEDEAAYLFVSSKPLNLEAAIKKFLYRNNGFTTATQTKELTSSSSIRTALPSPHDQTPSTAPTHFINSGSSFPRPPKPPLRSADVASTSVGPTGNQSLLSMKNIELLIDACLEDQKICHNILSDNSFELLQCIMPNFLSASASSSSRTTEEEEEEEEIHGTIDPLADRTHTEAELRRHTREVCARHVAPLIPTLTENAEFDPRLIEISKNLGPAGLQIKGFGAPGYTATEALLVTMEMARIDASFATFNLVHSGLAMRSIEVAGTPEQRNRWLPRMARLEITGAFGLTEPDYGSDATSLSTSAVKVPGGWILNGRKRWIGNATFSDIVIIWARDQECKELYGFVVERGMAGFRAVKIEHKMSLRIVQNADIFLDDCFVPDSNHLSGAKNFASGTQKVLESSRALVAATAVGILLGTSASLPLGAYDRALKYVQEREQFKRPVASFQLVQERLMRALGILQAGILTILNLGRLMDKEEATMAHIALAKAWCSKYGREGVALCRESVGGNGIIADYGIMVPFIDMESIYTYEGTYDINILLAGREVLGNNAIV